MVRVLLILSVWAVACGDDAPPIGSEGGAPCATDQQCDDGRFCNGVELCLPTSPLADTRGCAVGALPCMEEAQTCIERSEACVTLCEVTNDADGDGVAAVECGGIDCADNDRNTFPGNIERCDGAGHDEDCVAETFGDQDIDGDGAVSIQCFNTADDGTEFRGNDCNDARSDTFPSAEETCDQVDNDCDGTVDEGVTLPGFVDSDGDGDGDAAEPTMGCPDQTRFSLTGTDCNDRDVSVNGFQVEICDGLNNDCDDAVDENPRAVAWYPDRDADLFGDAQAAAEDVVVSCTIVPGYSVLPSDCDDSKTGINPSRPEACDGLDNDCNGLLDFVIEDGNTEDDDRDGIADIACAVGGEDCDDNNPLVFGAEPGSDPAPELCEDLIDNDCDGVIDEDSMPVDWYADLDSDAYGDSDTAPVSDCSYQPGRSFRMGDCDDSDPGRNPGVADQACNMIDEDCDGEFDEDALPTRAFFRDDDGDGAGVETDVVFACTRPPGYGPLPRDCSPADPTVTQRFSDEDGDEFGGEALVSCEDGSGVETAGDCRDGDPVVSPAAAEVCDAVDNDCNGVVDETGIGGCPVGTAWDSCTAGVCVAPVCVPACGFGAGCVAGACESVIDDVEVSTIGACVVRESGRIVCWGHTTDLPGGSGTSPYLTEFGVAEELVMASGALCARNLVGWSCTAGTEGNRYLQLGLGHPRSVSPPVPAALPDAIDLMLGLRHSCAVQPSRGVACWGSVMGGAIGDGFTIGRASPTSVVDLFDGVQVAVGGRELDRPFSCAVVDRGGVFCWGPNLYGQLGDGTTTLRRTPVATLLIGTDVDPVRQVECGARHCCARRESGVVDCWGDNRAVAGGGGASLSPVRIPRAGGADLSNVASITTSELAWSTCALTGTGEVWCWGQGTSGALGNGASEDAYEAVRTTLPMAAKSISFSGDSGCALLADDSVWCWGNDTHGECGQGRVLEVFETPVRVMGL